ncbi:MAG: AI-2E family transporter [Trueperaceae bacterium]
MNDDRPPPHDPYSEQQVTALEIVWRNPWVRALAYLALTVFAVWLLITLRRGYAFALQVAIIGFIIAYILNPLVEALSRLRIGRLRVARGLAVVLIYLVLLQVFVLGSILIGQVVTQLGEFVRRIPVALENVGAALTGFQVWLAGVAEGLPGFLSERLGLEQNDQLAVQVQEQLASVLARAVEALTGLLEQLVTGGPSLLVSGATNIISTTLQVILILLASAYFLYDFPRFTNNAYRLVPVRWRPLYSDLVRKADGAVGGYMRGQLLITLVLGVLVWIGLSIVGVPLALAISFLAAIFNLVPYLGPIIGVVPAVLLGFTVSPLTAGLAVVVFVIANQLEGNVLAPLILSRSTNLHPLTVLLAIMAGIGLLGLVGALLAVPFVALVKIVVEDYLLNRPAYREEAVVELSEVDRKRV